MAKFTEKKVVEIIGYIFNKLQVIQLPYRKLMKLLYLCDRTMYDAYRTFITHDTFKSMKNGPVLVNTDDLLVYSENDSEKFYFKNFIEKKGDTVWYKKPKKTVSHSLNDKEVGIIDSVIELFGDSSEEQIMSFCHEMLPEWKDPKSFKIVTISEEDIRHALGIDSEQR